jgi:hypothetical protein
MYNNSIVIIIEDLHSGHRHATGQNNFPNYAAAVIQCLKLNDYYSDNCIPKIAEVKA